MAAPALGEDHPFKQYPRWNKKLPGGVTSSIVVAIESEFMLRRLMEVGENSQIAYRVDRSKKQKQAIVLDIIDLTGEPELPERPAKAAPQPLLEQSLLSELETQETQ